MKKLFSVILVIVNVNCFAQANKWFVSLTAAPSFGGPAASLKNQLRDQGYGDMAESTFVIFWGDGSTQYPRGGAITLLASGGKKLNERKSLYFVVGIAEKATIEGFDAKGYSNGLFGLFAGTIGNHVSVKYTTYQFSAGYMYSSAKSRVKFGFGPSVYIFSYGISENFAAKENHIVLVPGGAFNLRIPFGKERKLVGVELVFNSNIAPPVKMKTDHTTGFHPGNANMISANLGLALSFRR